MIQPTLRAFTLFTIGVPVALLLVIYQPDLWLWSFDWGAFVLIAIGTDFLLAFPRRMLRGTAAARESGQRGERAAVTVTLEPTPPPRPTRFELVRGQRPDPDPDERIETELLA